MNKQEYLSLLETRLRGIPKEDIDRTIDYYNEILSDKTEDGMSIEEAIASLGSIDEIVDNVLSDVSIPKLVKEKIGLNRKLKTWEIVLLASTFFIWLPLLLVFGVVIISLYICIWSGVISLGVGAISCVGASIVSLTGIVYIFTGNFGSGLVLIGMGFISAGVAVLLGIVTFLLAKTMVVICKRLILKIKSLIVQRGGKNEI